MSEMDTNSAADAIEGIMNANDIDDFDDKSSGREAEESTEELTHEGAEVEDEIEEAADDALEEEPAETDEEESIESLQQLADALDVPLEELLGSMTTTLKASGEDHTVTLAELQKSYQQEADYTKKSMALADERRGFEADRQARIEQFQANHAGLDQMTRMAGEFLKAEFNSPQLAALRESNPSEWTARRSELERQFNQLGQVRQEAAQQYETFHKNQQEQYILEQGRILQETVEGWGEERLQESIEVIKDLGFHDDELSSVVDARLFKGALRLKAAEDRVRELEAKIAKGSEAAQKVKQKPAKIMKAGKSAKVTRSKLQKAKASLRQSAKSSKDNTQFAAAVIEELL